MTSFVLKVIAMITMVIDHLGNAWLKHTTEMNVIGRIAFPIFAFQISEGYTHTKNLKKYFFRLTLFAFLSQIPFMLFRSLYTTGFALNIFFTLTVGLLAIFCYDKFTSSTLSFVKNEKICGFLQKYDIIIPVPMTKKKVRKRGYNQSELIAKQIAKKIPNLKLESRILVKTNENRTQSSLNKKQRQENVKDVYKIQNAEKIKEKNTVFITDQGNRFHYDLNCGGIKRTIYMIRLSEVGNRKKCSRCET